MRFAKQERGVEVIASDGEKFVTDITKSTQCEVFVNCFGHGLKCRHEIIEHSSRKRCNVTVPMNSAGWPVFCGNINNQSR